VRLDLPVENELVTFCNRLKTTARDRGSRPKAPVWPGRLSCLPWRYFSSHATARVYSSIRCSGLMKLWPPRDKNCAPFASNIRPFRVTLPLEFTRGSNVSRKPGTGKRQSHPADEAGFSQT